MATYMLLERDPLGNRVASHYANGREYLPGDTIETDSDMEKRFPGKFRKMADDDPGTGTLKDLEIAKLRQRIAALEARSNPTLDLSHKEQNDEKSASNAKGPGNSNGADATGRFEGAEDLGLLIFTNGKKPSTKKERFKVFDSDAPNDPIGEDMTEKGVRQLIKEMSEAE